MHTDIYDISVATCKQVVQAVVHCLDKAVVYCHENDIGLDELIEEKLNDTMRPLRYQIFAVGLHSRYAMEALKSGSFYRPESYPEERNYAEMHQYLKEALEALNALTPETINALEGGDVTVKIPNLDIPFTITNFILSFSHPNLYFHASTVYAILRRRGVPLDKRDFLGDFRLVDS